MNASSMAPNHEPMSCRPSRGERPPLDSEISERSMATIATTASTFSECSMVHPGDRRRSSLKAHNVAALKIDLAEAKAEAETTKIHMANMKRERETERDEARQRIAEVEEEMQMLKRSFQEKLASLGKTLEDQSNELSRVKAERDDLMIEVEELRSQSTQSADSKNTCANEPQAPSRRALFRKQGMERAADRRRASNSSSGSGPSSSGANASTRNLSHRRRGSSGSESVSASLSSRGSQPEPHHRLSIGVDSFRSAVAENIGDSISNLMNMSIGGGMGNSSRRASNEDHLDAGRAEDLLWSDRNLMKGLENSNGSLNYNYEEHEMEEIAEESN